MGLGLILRKYRLKENITSCDSSDARDFAFKNKLSTAEGSKSYLGFRIMLSAVLQHGGREKSLADSADNGNWRLRIKQQHR